MNVETGDLAILIKSLKGTNIGCICEVQKFVGTRVYPDMTLHNLWAVRFMNPIEVELLGSDGNLYPFVQREALVCDDWLRPIPKLPEEEEVETILEKEIEHV